METQSLPLLFWAFAQGAACHSMASMWLPGCGHSSWSIFRSLFMFKINFCKEQAHIIIMFYIPCYIQFIFHV